MSIFKSLKKEINPERIQGTRFINGYARYYAQPLSYKGQMYLITSQWYQYSYQPYKAWLQKNTIY